MNNQKKPPWSRPVVRAMILILALAGLLILCLLPLTLYQQIIHGTAQSIPPFLERNPKFFLGVTAWLFGVATIPAVLLILTILRPLIGPYRRRSRFSPRPTGELWNKLIKAEPAFSLTEALRWMADVAPMVEETAGEKFQLMPMLKLADWQEAGQILARDRLPPKLRELGKKNDLAGKLLELTTMQATLPLAPFIIGKYGISDRLLYLLPRNTQAMLEMTGMPRENLAAIVTLTLAHELTHALQDEKLDLRAHLSGRDPAAVHQFNLLMEGQAMVVQEQIAKKAGYEAELELLNDLLLGKLAEQAVNDEQLPRRMAEVYHRGRAFMRRCYEQGGSKAMWDVLEQPPKTLSEGADERPCARLGKTP